MYHCANYCIVASQIPLSWFKDVVLLYFIGVVFTISTRNTITVYPNIHIKQWLSTCLSFHYAHNTSFAFTCSFWLKFWLNKIKLLSNCDKSRLSSQWNCWLLRCGWNIACHCCFNYISILNLTPSFNGLGKDNCKTRRETFKFWDLASFILDIWR